MKFAQDRGAVGVLIFVDPGETGRHDVVNSMTLQDI